MKKLALLALATMFMATGCGKVLKSFNVGIPADNKIKVDFTLQPEYQLAILGNLDIMGYGNVFFEPGNNERGLYLGAEVNTAAFLKESWVNYKLTRILPNGETMPGYVTQDLVKVEVPAINNNYVTPYVYFGLKDLNTNVGDYYVGLALSINAIDDAFPQGLSITQVFQNKYNQPIVGITAYGPRIENGEMTVPGGFFVAANISNIINGQHFTTKGLTLGLDDAGMSSSKLYMLNNQFKNALKSVPAVEMKNKSSVSDSLIENHNKKVFDNMMDY